MFFKIKMSCVVSVVMLLLACAFGPSGAAGQRRPRLNSPAAKAAADKQAADEKAAADKKAVDEKAAADKAAAEEKAKTEPYVPANGVYKYGLIPADTAPTTSASDPARQAGMTDIIIVKVKNLQKLLDESKCKTPEGADKPNCTKRDIVLYFDGREMKGLVPESGAPILEEETLRFHIQRTPESDEAWADLLGAPPLFSKDAQGNSLFDRNVRVSVGLAGEHQIRSQVDKFSFVRVHRRLFWYALIGLLALLIIVYVLARNTGLLRDGGQPIGENRKGKETDESPYSLGRCQMAFWFFLVLVSFFFILLITWQFNTVTEQALALMGISAATALGAAIVTASKDGENESDVSLHDAAIRYPPLKAEKEQLQAAIKQFQISPRTLTAAEQVDLQAKIARLKKVKKQIRDLSTVSQGFLDDLLTDIHGYSFHRLQIFVWTLVLGFIFLHGVYNRLAMPAFSATLLALLGISGATYIGFKIPERQEPTPPPPPPGDVVVPGNANANANANASANANVGGINNADPDDV